MDKNHYIHHSDAPESSLNILAISKNPKILDQLCEQIDSDHIRLIATRSRRRGLQILKEQTDIQALWLDIDLLIGEAPSFATEIQQIIPARHGPKLICAGDNEHYESAKTALRFGAIDYISAPFDKNELMDCLARINLLLEKEKVNLQQIDQGITRIHHLLTELNEHHTELREQSATTAQYIQQAKAAPSTTPTHPNPYMQKALLFNQLQKHKHEFDELPEVMSKAWNILVEIFTTEISGQRAYVTTVAVGSSVAASSTHRHLALLFQKKLIRRQRDPSDKRRIEVRLTKKAWQQLTEYFDKI